MSSTGARARPQVVVVGAGFAGMNAAHALRGVDAAVTVVDQNNYHTFQPLLYQVSTGYLPPEEVGAALRSVFRRQRNLTVRVAAAVSVDWHEHTVALHDGAAVPFDYLVLAVGAETNFFGIPGMAEHSWPLYTLSDAVRLRTHLLASFERLASPRTGEAQLRTVVVGGGPTGVETAAALTTMAAEVIGPVAALQVTLVEAGPRLLNAFHPRSSRRALDDLRRRGVDVQLGRTVHSADASGVTLDGGELIPAPTVIWAAGVQANHLAHTLGVELRAHGRVPVDEHLQLAGHRATFVAGDFAAVDGPETAGFLPMLAPVAIQSGRHAGQQVARAISGQPLTAFRYHDKGTMAVLGRGDAVAELPLPVGTGRSDHYRLRFGGLPAWLLWVGVHIVYLIGFRNRIKVLVDWGWSYFTSRGAGAILLAPLDAPPPPSENSGTVSRHDV